MKAPAASGGKQAKVQPQRMTLRPMVHQDTWLLQITPPAPNAPDSAGPTISWERRKKPANPPSPPRAGVTMAYHKGRGIMFGGVHDVELTEEGMDSEFFGDLHAWNTERNRFFQLNLRRPRAAGKKQLANQMRSKERSKADEEELLQNLAALEKKKGLRNDDEDSDDLKTGDTQDEEEPDQPGKQAVIRFELPHRRFNAQLAVQDDTLFIFGGTFEKGDREFTFNDMYSIDLDKLNGVKEIFYNEPENWNLMDDGESDEELDEDEEDDDEEENDNTSSHEASAMTPTESLVPSPLPDVEQQPDVEEQETESALHDSRPLPRPFETLREFFSRSSEEWQKLLLERIRERGLEAQKTVKELRKEAFSMAEEKWWDSREEIMALEDEQEAAGIGDVVNIADRGDSSNIGSAGRRR